MLARGKTFCPCISAKWSTTCQTRCLQSFCDNKAPLHECSSCQVSDPPFTENGLLRQWALSIYLHLRHLAGGLYSPQIHPHSWFLQGQRHGRTLETFADKQWEHNPEPMLYHYISQKYGKHIPQKSTTITIFAKKYWDACL